MEDESDTAKLNIAPKENVTFQLEDEDDLADVELPVSASNGEEPTAIADGNVEPDMLWLDNTIIAHPMLGITYFFMLWASLYSRSPDLAAIFPFMFVPACAGVYWWWKTYRDDVSLTYLQSQFIVGFAPVSLAVTFLQLISLMLWLGVVVAFIEGSKTLLGFSLGVSFYMFIAVTLVEELVKVSVAAHVREQNATRADSKSFVAGMVFMSLGLGTAQAIFMAIVIYSATKSNTEADTEVDGEESSIFLVLGAVISVAFINIPLHCLCGYLASIRVALRAFSDGHTASSVGDNLKMALLPSLVRTSFLTCLVVGIVALEVVGIVLANLLGILLVYFTYRFVKAEESKLPDEYKAQVGYLSIFNEGGDDDDDDMENQEEGVLKSNDDIQLSVVSSS